MTGVLQAPLLCVYLTDSSLLVVGPNFPQGPPSAVSISVTDSHPAFLLPGCFPEPPQVTMPHLATELILKLPFGSVCPWHIILMQSMPMP